MTTTAPDLSLPCLVGGEELWGEHAFPVRYPFTGETVGAAPTLSRDQIEQALDLAGEARPSLDRHERA